MKDYRIELTVKNGLLWQTMKDFGHETVASLSRGCGVAQGTLGKMMNLEIPPLTKTAEVRPSVQALCDYFGVNWESLFPQEVHFSGLPKNKADRFVGRLELETASGRLLGVGSPDEVLSDPESLNALIEMSDELHKQLDRLPPKHKKVIEMRWGVNCHSDHTLEEVADFFGVTPERIRQIEAKALRLLRHPARTERLKHFTSKWDESPD